MAIVIINDEYLTDIADAIRTKNGLTDSYKPSEMAAAISQIEGGVFTSIKQYAIGHTHFTFVNPVQYDLSSYANKAKIILLDCMAPDGNVYGTNPFTIHIDADDNVTKIEPAGIGTGNGLSGLTDITATVVGGVLTVYSADEFVNGTNNFAGIVWSTRANIYYVQ